MSSTLFYTHAKHVTADGTTIEADLTPCTFNAMNSGPAAFISAMSNIDRYMTNLTITPPAARKELPEAIQSHSVDLPPVNGSANNVDPITMVCHSMSSNEIKLDTPCGIQSLQLWYTRKQFDELCTNLQLREYIEGKYISVWVKSATTYALHKYMIHRDYVDRLAHKLCETSLSESACSVLNCSTPKATYPVSDFTNTSCSHLYVRIKHTMILIGHIGDYLNGTIAQ